MDPKKTPRIPSHIRKEAYYCLKHFPWDTHLDEVAEKCPSVFANERKEIYYGKPRKNKKNHK